MRIFITGDKGMIGRQLIKMLRDDNRCELINDESEWDKYKAGNRVSFKEFPSGLIHEEEIDITAFDLKEFIDSSKPDLIINCAGVVSTAKCEIYPWAASMVNEVGVYNLVHAMKSSVHCDIHLIHFSTTAIYDPNSYDDGNKNSKIFETTPMGPQTIYGITKYAGEMIVKCYYPMQLWTILRPCFIYDYDSHLFRNQMSIVAQMIRWWEEDLKYGEREFCDRDILLNPNNAKDYMHVDDFIDIMSKIIFSNTLLIAGEDFNISLGQPTLFGNIQKIFSDLGFKSNRYKVYPEKDYLKNHIVVGDKVKNFFSDWHPSISIEDGIKKMMEKSDVF